MSVQPRRKAKEPDPRVLWWLLAVLAAEGLIAILWVYRVW
jgi:hypothetical protein